MLMFIKKYLISLLIFITIITSLTSCQFVTSLKQIKDNIKKNYLGFTIMPDLFREDVLEHAKIENDILYASTFPSHINDGDVYTSRFFAFNLKTKKIIWENRYLSSENIFSINEEISIKDNNMYLGVNEKVIATGRAGIINAISFFYCIDKNTGKQIFKIPLYCTNSPFIYNEYILIGSQTVQNTKLISDFSFNMINSLSGKVEFSYKINSKWTGAPAIYKNFCAIVTDDRSVYFFDLEKKRFISKQTNRTSDNDPFPYDSSPVVFNDLVFSINEKKGLVLAAYYMETGNIAWSRDRFTLDNKEYDLSCEQPFIYKDSLICHANIPSNTLLWIDPKSGILQKTSKITYPNFENMIITSGYYRSLLDGNKLYLFDDYGNNFPDIPIIKDDVFGYPNTLFCFNLDDDHLEFITEIAVDGYYYNIKSVDKDTLYLETTSCLYLIDKFNGNYKDFLFFKDGKVISKYDEIMKYSKKKLSEKAK